MDLMKGKKGLIMGVANERSIAWGISQKLSEAGADLAFTYLGDALKKRVVPLAEKLNSKTTFSCDVEKKDEVIKLFEDINLMSEKQYDEFLDSLNEEELDEIIGRFTAAGQARRAIAKRDKAQQKLKDTKTAVQARKDTKRAKLRTMAVKRLEKRRNPGIIKRATSKIGDVATKAKDALMR